MKTNLMNTSDISSSIVIPEKEENSNELLNIKK